MLAHGSDRHAAPACSKTVYIVSARIDGRQQRHGNAMTSVRIVDRLQDTAGVQEPPRGEISPLAWWNARKNCVRQVDDGWKAVQRDCAATKKRLRHVWGGRKAFMMAFALQIARRPISAGGLDR